MTQRNLSTGEITIDDDATRTDLETAEIMTGAQSDGLYQGLGNARREIYCTGLLLLQFSDASDSTLKTLLEASEILANIRTRLSSDEPSQTAEQRHGH